MSCSVCTTGVEKDSGIGPVSALSKESINALANAAAAGDEEDNKMGSGDEYYSDLW